MRLLGAVEKDMQLAPRAFLDAGVNPERRGQGIRRNRVLGSAGGGQRPVVQEHDIVGPAKRQVEIMQDEKDDHVVGNSDLPNGTHHIDLVARIEGARRLVQQEDGRAPHDGLRQARKLSLSAGQFVERRQREVANVQTVEDGLRADVEIGVRSAPVGRQGAQRGDDGFDHRQGDALGQRLRHVGHRSGEFRGRQPQEVAVVQLHLPRGGQQAGDQSGAEPKPRWTPNGAPTDGSSRIVSALMIASVSPGADNDSDLADMTLA